jgi:hypothetical protein
MMGASLLLLFLMLDQALSFQNIQVPSLLLLQQRRSLTVLHYLNHTRTTSLQEVLENTATLRIPATRPPPPPYYTDKEHQRAEQRNALKRELARVAIEQYDIETAKAGIAEDIMKALEPLCPRESPATHPDLNARWSFVFTGVPTIGMKLITLLSRISVGVPPVDFCDVFLEVSDRQSRAKATVFFKVYGIPMTLTIHTNLRFKPLADNNPKGTFLIEGFQKILVNGVEIPTPEKWKSERDLEITYLDDDMMIARTAGSDPHFLLRTSPCSTDDTECVIGDDEGTAYFHEARAKYGSDKLTRCLVDRAYGGGTVQGDQNTLQDILELVRSIFDRTAMHG